MIKTETEFCFHSNLAPTCRGTFFTGLLVRPRGHSAPSRSTLSSQPKGSRPRGSRQARLTRPPRLSESDGGQARFSYILYIPSTSSGPETCRRAHVVPPVEGLNILSILSRKRKFLYYPVKNQVMLKYRKRRIDNEKRDY